MKREKGKETFSIIVSVILALGLFLFLLADSEIARAWR